MIHVRNSNRPGKVHLMALSEQQRAVSTLVVLKQADTLLLELCTELNDLATSAEDDVQAERLIDLRNRALYCEGTLSRHIEDQDWESQHFK